MLLQQSASTAACKGEQRLPEEQFAAALSARVRPGPSQDVLSVLALAASNAPREVKSQTCIAGDVLVNGI